MENLSRTKHRIWRKSFYQIARVQTNDKKAVKDHLSRLRKTYGLIWCRVYQGYENYTFFIILPRVKQDGKWRTIIKPEELHYQGVRGCNKGKIYRASKVTIAEFRLALITAISTAGNTLKLHRAYADQVKSIKRLNNHQPLTYCKEWALPRPSKKNSLYKREANLRVSVEDLLENLKRYLDDGLVIIDRNIHEVDKSRRRGMVPNLGRWIKIIFPDHWSDEKVKAVKAEMVKCPWDNVPLEVLFPAAKKSSHATFKQSLLC